MEIRGDHDQGWAKPHDITKLKTGDNVSSYLCPALVPKDGEIFDFNVRQYKNSAFDKMSYHFILHKVNKEIVDLSVGAGKGQKVLNNDGKVMWHLNRHFPMWKTMFGKRWSDNLYFLTGGEAKNKKDMKGDEAKYTLRRIAMTMPQRWTIHRGHVMGGTAGTAAYRSYDDSRLYWIKGHRGKYNVFKNPEDSSEWSQAGSKKRKSIAHKLVASITKGKDEADGHDNHRVVCKEGVDCGLILTMLQTVRWEHYIGVALTLAPMAQASSHYQLDDGRIPRDSAGKNPVQEKKQKEKEGGALLELDETEEDELEDEFEFDEDLDDGIDDVELAKLYESGGISGEFGDEEDE